MTTKRYIEAYEDFMRTIKPYTTYTGIPSPLKGYIVVFVIFQSTAYREMFYKLGQERGIAFVEDFFPKKELIYYLDNPDHMEIIFPARPGKQLFSQELLREPDEYRKANKKMLAWLREHGYERTPLL